MLRGKLFVRGSQPARSLSLNASAGMVFEPWFSRVKVVPSGAKEPLKVGTEPLPLSGIRISGALRGAPRQDTKPLGEIKDKTPSHLSQRQGCPETVQGPGKCFCGSPVYINNLIIKIFTKLMGPHKVQQFSGKGFE